MVDADDLPGVVAMLTLGGGLAALFAGYGWFWMVFVLGFAVATPLTALLVGDDEERERWAETGRADGTAERSAPRDREDALDLLRERYARGELDDVEFERKVERLLETESVAEAEQVLGGDGADLERADEREHGQDGGR